MAPLARDPCSCGSRRYLWPQRLMRFLLRLQMNYESRWAGFDVGNLRQNARHVVCPHKVPFSRSGLNPHLDWQTPFIKVLAFKTAKAARISELI